MFNITNFSEHPTRPGHTIFRFYEKERADFFNDLLNEEGLWFENNTHEEGNRTIYFFGVKNRDLKVINQKNYLVNAKFRRPFIPNNFLRWAIFTFAMLTIFLAIMGYINKH